MLDHPSLKAARSAVDQVLSGHEPYPALAVDRYWTLVSSNRAVSRLLAGIDAALLQPPVNVLRLSLHPNGLAPRIINLPQWREHLLVRLRQQVEATADTTLATLLDELRLYPAHGAATARPAASPNLAGIVVPLELNVDGTVLAMISTTTVFGTPIDVTLSELAIEAFFPADAATAEALRRLASG